MIEYVLMLIITVALVLALISQVFKPFGEFIDNYMGKYVGCLLEYGELPTLNSSTPSAADEDSECNKRFANGTLANGRPPNGSGKNGGEDSEGGDSSKNGSSGDSGGGSSSGGSSGSYAGSASRGGSQYMNSRRRPSMGIDSGSDRGGGGKVVEIALESGGGGAFFKSSNGGRYIGPGRKTHSVGITGLTEAERKKLEKKADGAGSVITTSETIAPPPKKTAVKKPEVKAVIEEEKPLTVGNFIRYLFIAALVIALVIFIGGQALQMSKSFDK